MFQYSIKEMKLPQPKKLQMNIIRLSLSTLIITGFLLLSSANRVNAQSNGVGIKAGPSITSHLKDFRFVSGDIDLELTPFSSAGVDIGLIFRHNISKKYRIQVEPSIHTMGARYEEGFELRGFNFQTESKTELLYIQVPLLFQISTTPPDRLVYGRQYSATTYHLTGGVFGGYLLNARFSGTNTGAPIGIDFAGEFSNDLTDQYSAIDAGVILGVGLESGRRNKIGFEARGLLSVLDSGGDTEFSFEPQNLGVVLAFYVII
jgi:hypothetical protein